MAIVLVPLAPGFEELEAVTVIDLLRRAQIEVVSAGLASGPVKGSRGTVLVPDTTLDEALARDYDMVVLPGGQPGATNLENDARLREFLKRMAKTGKYTAAICAAPKVLAAAGLLDGKRATGFPGSVDIKQFPRVRLEALDVVTDGRIVTSRGPGTAMDFALELIGLLAGREKRDQVETALQRPSAHRARTDAP
jgi:4-methyl-5(b-hydroxyethyl)-thiazole monophosphate biosynthesis